ncbi:Putative calcium channel [Komagataella phaffii CBS 7435]|uniref:Putative calcium channel n=1 Tax=Komagataella phaffii (strain ATCC 76273 / CBS 7435 / CECT 11047 / NRRL Y-11430 / Wegner 21-1) TaxID=981350 RepID=F2QS16_KOMPC|nr:Putative calcium channel [Komagataella phaffii CBS 7435]
MILLVGLLIYFFTSVLAGGFIQSTSLLTCMENSGLTASYFDVKYNRDSGIVDFEITAISTISGYVEAEIEVIVYGITIVNEHLSICDLNLPTICPLAAGHIDVDSSYTLSTSITSQVPGIAYTIPDLDARVRVIAYSNSTDTPVACVEALLSNGKTVQTKYAAWPIAAISGLGLITSGVISIVGHSNTAAHIASNSLSLFIYFQSIAITAMMAVNRVPPIAASWAQNFQWSMGIIYSRVVQSISNWYVQSTGGESTAIIKNKHVISISVQKMVKRSFGYLAAANNIIKRSNYDMIQDSSLYTTDERSGAFNSKILVLRGIQRVAYLANIEITDLFMTGIIFLIFFVVILTFLLFVFKAIVELLIYFGAMHQGKFGEYRANWSTITKGSLYRLALLSFPQVSLLCLWQWTVTDSVGTVVVAVVLFLGLFVLLLQSAVKVVLTGRSSIRNYKNPAYLLFGDAKILNKFGFLYVQFRADKYYWVLVLSFELNFLLFFSKIFNQPDVVSSVAAIVYFVVNAVCALILLIMTIVTCALALVRKNPDTRYQPMKDDRVSFIPRTTDGGPSGLNNNDTELQALGVAAMSGHRDSGIYNQLNMVDDESSTSEKYHRRNKNASYDNLAQNSNRNSFSSNTEPHQMTSAMEGSMGSLTRPNNVFYQDTSYHGYDSDRKQDVRWN